VTTITASATPSILVTVPSPSPASTGESIYRTIMNRLTALEVNHTLYARYVEEQTSGVRDVLKRLGEDIGRLEGIVSFSSFCLVNRLLPFRVAGEHDARQFSALIFLDISGQGTDTDVPPNHTRMGNPKK
jgi:hypothetical protein